eukprot:Nk52_evm9s222 gene=Nk52_evmTU9s222
MDWTQAFVDDGSQAHPLLLSRASRLLGGSYGAKVAYCFCLNYMLGVGALGVPHAFVEGGILLSCLCMLCVAVISVITVVWMAEVCARAQPPECRESDTSLHDVQECSREETTPILRGGSRSSRRNPAARPSFALRNKYEVTELCEFFMGQWGKYTYQSSLMFLMYTGLWAYSSVFLTSVAEMFPLNYLCGECEVDKQEQFSIMFYSMFFSAIVVPLSCLDLTEQISVQVFLTVARFLTFFLMIGSCIVAILTDPDDSPVKEQHNYPFVADFALWNSSNFGVIFTTSVFSLLFQHSIPGLIHPIKNKRRVVSVLVSAIVTTAVLYVLLGTLCACYFGAAAEESINLNWKAFTFGVDEGSATFFKNTLLRFFRYIIVLFPAVDVLSVFPLIAITLGNSLEYSVGRVLLSASTEREGTGYSLLRSHQIFRIAAAVPPIIACLFYRKLAMILQVSGLFGLYVAFFTPALLILLSRKKCERVFNGKAIPTMFDTVLSHPFFVWLVLAFATFATGCVLFGLMKR